MFPSITDNDQYDIYLFAGSAFDTIHADYKEVRFGDGSLDINSSKGSNSSLLGYYADVKLENNSKRKVEIFSLGSEITESSK